MRLEQELACDDHALTMGVRASEYAGYLISVARVTTISNVASYAAIGLTHSQLERRIRAILNPRLNHRLLRKKGMIINIIAVFSCAATLAQVRPVRQRIISSPEITTSVNTFQDASKSLQDKFAQVEKEWAEVERIMQETPFFPPSAKAQKSDKFTRPLTPTELGATMIAAQRKYQQSIASGKIASIFIHQNGAPEVQVANKKTFDYLRDKLLFGHMPVLCSFLAPHGADQQIQMKIHGVTPEFIATMEKLGYANLSSDQLLAFKIYGVDKELIENFQALGCSNLGSHQLIIAKSQGFTATNLADIQKHSSQPISFDEAVQQFRQAERKSLEIIAKGFTEQLFWNERRMERKEPVNDALLEQVQLSDEVQAILSRPHTDEEFAKVRQEIDNPSVEYFRLKKGRGPFVTASNMRAYGVTPEFIAELKMVGYKRLSSEDYIRLKRYGVTADFIRELAAQGSVNLSVNDLIDLKIQSVAKSVP